MCKPAEDAVNLADNFSFLPILVSILGPDVPSTDQTKAQYAKTSFHVFCWRKRNKQFHGAVLVVQSPNTALKNLEYKSGACEPLK